MTTTETITDITSISTQETVDYDDRELRDFLWQMIDQHRLSSSAKDLEDKKHDTTWELVIIQDTTNIIWIVLNVSLYSRTDLILEDGVQVFYRKSAKWYDGMLTCFVNQL